MKISKRVPLSGGVGVGVGVARDREYCYWNAALAL